MNEDRTVRQGEIFRHFKGNLYQIIAIAYEEESMDKVVVYQALYGTFEYYTRKLTNFFSEVDHVKYPDVLQKYRFEKVCLNNNEENVDVSDRKVFSDNKDETFTSNEKVKETDTSMVISNEPMLDERSEEAREKFMRFLETKYYSDKIDILVDMKNQNMLNEKILLAMAVSIDCIVEDGDIDKQYKSIKSCLDTLSKFQIKRDKEIKVIVR